MNPIISEFSDDFMAESEQLIGLIRMHLLAAEEAPLRNEDIQELFRAFHTLKGISGMMGFVAVETIAHSLESKLKELQKIGATLFTTQLDIFIKGIQFIETNLAKQGIDSDSILKKWDKIIQKDIIFQADFHKQPKINLVDEKKQSQMSETIRVVFTSSKENFAKNININTVRALLENNTSIISSKPRTNDNGVLQFEFIVNSKSSLEEIIAMLPVEIECSQISPEKDTQYDSIAKEPLMGHEGIKEEPTEHDEATEEVSTSMLRSGMIRVEISRLEDLMTMVGDLVISRSRLDEFIQTLAPEVGEKLIRPIEEVNMMMEKQLRALREGVMRIRMVRMADAFDKMQFVIHDVVRETKKKVQLKVSGRETEIDKYIVEKILDSLLHIVRNSLSHGIEPPEERAKVGKPEIGTLSLNAFTAGDSVVIEIEDDGRGIDEEKLIDKALESGIKLNKKEVSHQDLLDIMCKPGISSQDEADKYSGRGVGMDVARRTIYDLGGTIDFESSRGKGTKFIIELPLTIAILDALILKVGSKSFALPQSMVNEVIQVTNEELVHIENNKLLSWRGGILPVICLADQFSLPLENGSDGVVLVVGSGLKSLGLQVKRIEGIREIVVRTLTDPLVKVPGISGATELGDGKIILILDAPTLVKQSLNLKNKDKKNSSNKIFK